MSTSNRCRPGRVSRISSTTPARNDGIEVGRG
jgi:hypothetical protein